MHRQRIALLLSGALLAAALILPATAPAATPTFNASVNKLITHHYPQDVENYLDSLGITTLGFRLAGTPADNAAADYIQAKFQAMGLANVREEGVPVDAWNMQGAWVQVNGRTMAASQFDGVPGTKGPITAPIVYVGMGTEADYAGKDVTGKLVLVDLELDDFWMNFVGHEAAVHGAVGVVTTYNKNTYPWYAMPNSLGANDGEYDMSFAPLVYISRADGAWLRSLVAAGPVSATLNSAVDITMHDFATPANGGLGFNVVGEIPGTDPNAKAILIAAHHDAHFRAGLDDTGAVSNMLMIAKAMKLSGYHPKRTIIFLATTGEEFGYTNCWYDWCAGAWYAATVTHGPQSADPWTGPDGKLAAMINLELMARKGAVLSVGSSTALAPWIKAAAKESPSLLPYGIKVETPISSWEDGWTFTAAGVPAMVLEAGGKHYDEIYHTTVETKALVSYAYLGQIAKFVYRLNREANAGLLPYRLQAQAADLAASVSGTELKAAGADGPTVDAAVKAVADYYAATKAWSGRRPHIPAAHRAAVNDGLFAVESSWNTKLTGLDIWDYQAYPFQQTLWDTEALNAAVGFLNANPVAKDEALAALGNVASTYYATTFGETVFAKDLERHQPDNPLITWGGQVDNAWHVDLLPQIEEIGSGDYATATTELTAVRDGELNGVTVPGYTGPVHIDGLNQRLVDMTSSLNDMTTALVALK
jgi:hypothetical protein